VVFGERPAGLPLGDGIDAEATFVGYFLKNMSYTDKLGNLRGVPLLIGRLHLRGTPPRTLASQRNAPAGWLAYGAGLAATVVFALMFWMWNPWVVRTPKVREPLAEQQEQVANWLDQAENPTEANSRSAAGHSEGSAPQTLPADWLERHEHH
jgi:hypothetical protein